MSAPEGLEYKNAASPDAMPVDAAAAVHEGVIEALVAVTGVKDDVGDVIVPGAFRNTLDLRKPKVCLGHDWNRPIGKTLQIKELMPGDPNLPKTTADGKPWPKEAGAVWAQFQTNMDIDDGKNAFHSAKFYGPESTYSIGYKATNAKHKNGVRYIHELDLFEFGPVLHPANRLATLQSIKGGEPEGIENADLMASWEAVKSSEPEGMTFQDYSASLALMEMKARYVNDANYWGYPKGTLIRPGMKPRGKSARDIRKMGLIPSRTVGTEAATGPADAPTKGKRGKAEDLARRGTAGELELGYEIDYDREGNVLPGRVRARNPKGKDEEHVQAIAEQITDSYYHDGSKPDDYDPYEGLLDEGITPNELREDLENSDELKPARLGDEPEWAEQIDQAVADYTEMYNALAKEQVAERRGGDGKPAPAAKPAAEKPAPAAKPRAAKAPAKSKPITPGGYAVTRDGFAGSVVVIKDGQVEISKPGDPSRFAPLADVSGGPAEPVTIKLPESQRHAAVNVFADAYYPEEEMGARWTKNGLEILDLGRAIDSLDNELDIMEENPERKKSAGAGTRSLRAKLVKMATFDNAPEADATPQRPAGLEEFGPETGPLSSKPTGGRSIEDIVNSLPINDKTQNVRYRIAHGAAVLDDPGGSGIFAVGPQGQHNKGWSVTVGAGFAIPAERIIGSQTNESGTAPTNVKNVQAWLKAMGELRDKDGNPPPYGTATADELIAWEDADGRRLAKALEEVTVPAYLKAIGKEGGFKDKTTAANWGNNPGLAATKLPPAAAAEFAKLAYNTRQAYILGRTEGNDHETSMQRARDMIANARGARQSAEAARDALPTGPSYAPVNRTIATDDNGAESTPEGEISTTRLLSLDRTTGPAAIAAMERPELERHDAELTRRAEALGRAGVISPAHQAIKDALDAKKVQAIRDSTADEDSPERQRNRVIEAAPAKVADARTLGRRSRGDIALREANLEIPFGSAGSNFHRVMRSGGGPEGAVDDGVFSGELARDIDSEAEFLERADLADRVADVIDSWGVDLGEESDLPDRLRGWAQGVRSVLNSPPVDPEIIKIRQELAQHPDDPQEARRTGWSPRGLMAFTIATRRLGLDVNPVSYTILNPDMSADEVREEARERARGGFARYGTDQVQQALDEIDSWGADLGKGQKTVDNARAWVEGVREGVAEYDAANKPKPNLTLPPTTAAPAPTVNEQEEERRYQAAVDRAAAAEASVPDQATARANAQARREAVRRGDAAPRTEAPTPTPAPVSEVGAGSFLTAEDRAEMDRLRSEGRDNEVAKYYADARRRARAEGTQDQATITPELLDEAAESEAASVGLSETPDGVLEVEPEVAERQDRVEKLIKDADDGKLNLAEQSTEDLTATRRDLVDELRLQTAIRRRAPRAPRPAATATDAPKTRPGLAGAAEDHAEALRSGDTAAIERTRARLESSIRRSRTDSDVARSLADSVTSPDANDADQLSDLAKRLRAESRERRNATARKRRTAKRIERERLQSLLGAVDTELRGRGVQLDEVRPELLAPDEDGTSRPKLTAKQKTVMLSADQDGWIVGHGVTVNSLITNNLASWPRGTTVPLSVQKRGSSWAQLNENGLAELALLRNP